MSQRTKPVQKRTGFLLLSILMSDGYEKNKIYFFIKNTIKCNLTILQFCTDLSVCRTIEQELVSKLCVFVRFYVATLKFYSVNIKIN